MNDTLRDQYEQLATKVNELELDPQGDNMSKARIEQLKKNVGIEDPYLNEDLLDLLPDGPTAADLQSPPKTSAIDFPMLP